MKLFTKNVESFLYTFICLVDVWIETFFVQDITFDIGYYLTLYEGFGLVFLFFAANHTALFGDLILSRVG